MMANRFHCLKQYLLKEDFCPGASYSESNFLVTALEPLPYYFDIFVFQHESAFSPVLPLST